MTVADKIYQNAGNPAVTRFSMPAERLILDLGCGACDNARVLARGDRNIGGFFWQCWLIPFETTLQEVAGEPGSPDNLIFIPHLRGQP